MPIQRILLESLAEQYNVLDSSFAIQGHVVPINTFDVYCILGLVSSGEKIEMNSKKSDQELFDLYKCKIERTITFKHLEEKMVGGPSDDHFIRMFTLYAIGTILAPSSKKYVSSTYLHVVQNTEKISAYDWSHFTLEYLLEHLALFKNNKRTGLAGNLAFLQVWFFEHFQVSGPFDYALHRHPLIQNWSKDKVVKRAVLEGVKKFSAEKVVIQLKLNDASVQTIKEDLGWDMDDFFCPAKSNNGNFQNEDIFDNNVNEEIHMDDSREDDKGYECHKQDPIESIKGMISYLDDRVHKRFELLEERTELIPQLFSLVQVIIKKLDGITNKQISKDNIGNSMGSNRKQNCKAAYEIEESVKDSVKEVLKEENPSSFDEDSTFRGVKRKINLVSSHTPYEKVKSSTDSEASEDTTIITVGSCSMEGIGATCRKEKKIEKQGTEEELENGKPCKERSSCDEDNIFRGVTSTTIALKVKSRTDRQPSRLCKSPFQVFKQNRNFGPKNGGADTDTVTEGLDLSDLELAAIELVMKEIAIDASQNLAHIGQSNLDGNILRSLVRPVRENRLDKWLNSEIINAYVTMLNSDCEKEPMQLKYVCTTYQSDWLALVGQRCKRKPKISDYTRGLVQSFVAADMVFLPMNNMTGHWWLCVLYSRRREFQILDSLNRRMNYTEVTRDMRSGIHELLQEVLSLKPKLESNWSDYNILDWEVVLKKNIPRQNDGCSCGIFILKYMQHWNGSEMTCEFSQKDVETFRKKMPAELIASPLNELSSIRDKLYNMAAMRNLK